MKALLLILTLFISALTAEEKIIINPQESYKSGFGRQVYFYIDKEHSLKIEDILKKEYQDKFVLSENENPQFGYTSDTIWLRLNLIDTNPSKRDWLLEIGYSGLDLIEFYSYSDNSWKKRVYGDLLPFTSRDFDYRNYLIRLDLSSEVSHTYYFRVKTNTSFVFPLYLYEAKTILENKFMVEGLFFFFYGVLIVMIFYN